MKPRIAVLALSLSLAGALSAQGLHQQIKVEREIVPVKREASRLNILPQLQLTPIARPQLSYSDKVVTADVPNSYTMLSPVAWGDKLYTSPYRGYLAFGVGAPTANAVVSAGYRAIDSDHTRLSIFGQYDGDIYTQKLSAPASDDRTLYWRDHTASIEADLFQTVGKKSAIDASADYTYAYHNLPLFSSSYGQSSSRGGLRAGFSSRKDDISYRIGLSYRHFGFYHQSLRSQEAQQLLEDAIKPVRQNLFSADLTGKASFSDNSSVAIDVNASFLRSSLSATPLFSLDEAIIKGGDTRGLIAITPHYDFNSPQLHLRLGAEVDLSINDGRLLHVAPEASIAWTPTQYAAFELKATGGATLNPLASLFEVSPYLNPYMTYGLSHLPLDLNAGITFGPFLGGTLELFGGYAKADSWLMPALTPEIPGGAVYSDVDLSAFHFGCALGYDYRSLLSARVSYENAPNSYDHSLYSRRDRAKHLVKARLTLTPIKPLSITAGWEFRAGRRIYETIATVVGDPTASNPPLIAYTTAPTSLGCISSLSVGAGYSFSDRLTIFARGENLLSRRFYHIGLRYSQGAYGLIGATLKF